VTLNKTFGAKIMRLRDAHGMTQEGLAKQTGISVQHISNLENGHREPCLNNMAKLGRAFDMNLSQLLQDVDT
jgi:transcriptional regulator with XRE-family HTH domain